MTDHSPTDPSKRKVTALVAVALASCVAIYATVFFEGSVSSWVGIAGGAVCFIAYFALRRVVQEAADLPDERLDEREILLRNRSYFESYRLLGGAVAASVLLVIVDDAVGDVVVSWSGAWASLLFLSAVLPSAVLAYRQQVSAQGLGRTQV